MYSILKIFIILLNLAASGYASDFINIGSIDKEKLVKALFYYAQPSPHLGIKADVDQTLSDKKLKKIEKKNWKVESLYGRNLFIDISGQSFNPSSYNHYNGDGCAESVIDELRRTLNLQTLDKNKSLDQDISNINDDPHKLSSSCHQPLSDIPSTSKLYRHVDEFGQSCLTFD